MLLLRGSKILTPPEHRGYKVPTLSRIYSLIPTPDRKEWDINGPASKRSIDGTPEWFSTSSSGDSECFCPIGLLESYLLSFSVLFITSGMFRFQYVIFYTKYLFTLTLLWVSECWDEMEKWAAPLCTCC